MSVSPISEQMTKFLKENKIPGCFVLMREDADGNGVTMNYGCDHIHELNVIRGAASVITELWKNDKGDLHTLVVAMAENIIKMCNVIDEVGVKDE